ncbi:MAG: M56 family metallopeptidase [Nitriliruptoraceae bacterium]
MDLGVLLSLPLESIALRAAIATVACVLMLRLLLTIGLRSSGARVLAALTPAVVLLAVIGLASAQPRLPTLMVPVEARDALAIRVAEGYLFFAPVVFPLLVAAWATIASVRLVWRIAATTGVRRRARAALVMGLTPDHVRDIASKVAYRLDVAEPFVTVVDDAPGGAYVVGTRHPIVVLDASLVERLDDDELEGVLAHELAHVRRRDNLVAGMLGSLRDAIFFAPGVGWAVRHLHRERELAADQAAVSVTGRPGALASGLLKVLDHAPRGAHACATLAPSHGLVDRVETLISGAPKVTAVRRTAELSVLALAGMAAVAAAWFVPTQMAGAERERDAFAVVWSPRATEAEPATRARAFSVYDRNRFDSSATTTSSVAASRYDEHSIENRRTTLRACGSEDVHCPTPDSRMGLGLRPRPVVTIDDAVTASWQAVPVGDVEDSASGLRMYWLSWIG